MFSGPQAKSGERAQDGYEAMFKFFDPESSSTYMHSLRLCDLVQTNTWERSANPERDSYGEQKYSEFDALGVYTRNVEERGQKELTVSLSLLPSLHSSRT